MSRVLIELYDRADYAPFQEYIRKAFHQKYILSEKQYLNWQYGENLFVAKSGKNIVGHFGFRDIAYKIGGQTKTVRVLMNLFVLEPYRLTGVAADLAEKTIKDAQYIFVSGYKKEASNIFKRIRPQWRDFGYFKRYFFILNKKAELLKGRKRENSMSSAIPLTGNFVFSFEKNIGEEFNAFWKKIKERYGSTVDRTAAYLQWRFADHPYFDYNIISLRESGNLLGYLVWREEVDKLFRIARIIDLVSDGDASDRALLQKFIENATAQKYDAADFMFFGMMPEKALVDSGYFEVSGTDFEDFPILFSPISFKKTGINIGGDFPAKDLDGLYITKADGDQDRPNPRP